MRTAAVDCGTNSIRLLIADVADDGASLTDVERAMTVVRLGEGVDAAGELSEAALDRTFAAVDDYADRITAHGAESVRFVATSATRDAGNREVFVEGVRERLGVDPEVISGEEEAALSFAGAASVLDWETDRRVLVVDLGGGSTEFVLGTAAGVESSISTDMGCVRFTERHLSSDPPTDREIAAAVSEVREHLDDVAAAVDLASVETVVGVAGTITTVAAEALHLTSYDRTAIHGAESATAEVREAADRLLSATAEQRAAKGFMHPGRVDVIGAGALIWRTILDRVEELTDGRTDSAIASEHDILDGIALSAAQQV
ncbi:MAG: Ppx/GppA phosphatase family protein [Nesterenkonia sp.]|nr:Ppx/GppA phosphatase family protein [Nesterenkonia sp.]